MELPESKLIKNQKIKFGPKEYKEDGKTFRITAKVRYDDQCGNGHNSFSITGYIDEKTSGGWREYSGGCIHEEIEKHFPKLKKYIKWHLTRSDGPRHYIANTCYHASNRDYNGLLAGEPNPRTYKTVVTFDNVPIRHSFGNESFMRWLKECKSYDFEIIEIYDKEHKYKKYTFGPYPEAKEGYQCPFDTLEQAESVLIALNKCKLTWLSIPSSFGEGKERNFEAARDSAVWPEATEEQLSLPKEELKKLLEERLPGLMQEFKKDMLELGFTY